MKVHLKKHAQDWIELSDHMCSRYHPALASEHYQTHEEDIDFIRSWWVRTRDEWYRRQAIQHFKEMLRDELTYQKK